MSQFGQHAVLSSPVRQSTCLTPPLTDKCAAARWAPAFKRLFAHPRRHALYTSNSTRTMSTLSQTAGSWPPRVRSVTTSAGSQEDQLALALDNIIATNQPFALNYVLTNERIWGGQALVQVRPTLILAQRQLRTSHHDRCLV